MQNVLQNKLCNNVIIVWGALLTQLALPGELRAAFSALGLLRGR